MPQGLPVSNVVNVDVIIAARGYWSKFWFTAYSRDIHGHSGERASSPLLLKGGHRI